MTPAANHAECSQDLASNASLGDLAAEEEREDLEISDHTGH